MVQLDLIPEISLGSSVTVIVSNFFPGFSAPIFASLWKDLLSRVDNDVVNKDLALTRLQMMCSSHATPLFIDVLIERSYSYLFYPVVSVTRTFRSLATSQMSSLAVCFSSPRVHDVARLRVDHLEGAQILPVVVIIVWGIIHIWLPHWEGADDQLLKTK